MPQRKSPRTKGKISFTKFFQKFNEGDSVAVVRELSKKFGYSKRLQGRTGKIVKKRGTAYEIEIKDLNKQKTFMIQPIHLRKIQEATAQ